MVDSPSFLPSSPSFPLPLSLPVRFLPLSPPSFSPYPVHVKGQIEEEERVIAKLDQQVQEMERRIGRQRKEMGG